MEAVDIDLTGDSEDLPPGVQPGTLGGTDEPPEQPVQSDPEAGQFASEEDVPPADVPWDGTVRDGSLGGDDGEEDRSLAQAAAETVGEGEDAPLPPDDAPEPDEEPPPALPEPTAAEPEADKPKRTRKKKKDEAKSGPVNRLYIIFEETQAEVDGNIIPVYVQRAFNVDGEVLEGVVARNRDLALARAGKLFGEDYEGNLAAVPAGMWEPKPVSNKPEPRYKVTVG